MPLVKVAKQLRKIRRFKNNRVYVCKYLHTILTAMLVCVHMDTSQSTILWNTSIENILMPSRSVSTSGDVSMQQL